MGSKVQSFADRKHSSKIKQELPLLRRGPGGGGEARGEGRGRDQDGVEDVLQEVHAAALRQAGGGRLQPLLGRGPGHHRAQEEVGNQVNNFMWINHRTKISAQKPRRCYMSWINAIKWIIKLFKSTMYRN